MPELPEVEAARALIEQRALRRRIVDVDDTDSYECRPHLPGEIRAALLGRSLTAAHRRGKSMWCETSGLGRSRTPGPTLGIHLGMSGKIVIADPRGRTADGGAYWGREAVAADYRFTRFALGLADGTRLLLVDPRRLGRVRLDPAIERLGPDAATITATQFRAALERGSAPVKARLLDQEAIAGVGNLLADQVLWAARVDPSRPVDALTRAEADRLHRAIRRAVQDATSGGGVHTLSIVEHRHAGGRCPRCGTEMRRATVGGRTTWYCPRDQT